MTREIDVSDPTSLSLDDRLYLQDHNRLPRGAKPVNNETRAKLAKKVEEAQRSEEAKAAEEDEAFNAEVSTDSYDSMNARQLKAELKARKVDPVSDDKDDLVEQLRSLDAEPEAV